MRFAQTSRWSLIACSLAACTPALDWRDVRPAGSGAAALFPCQPDRFARSVQLASSTVQMVLVSCTADGATYALSLADLGDPIKASVALAELRTAAARNLGGVPRDSVPMVVPGMTPSPLAERLTVDGQRADGHAVREQAAFFTRGVRVYQASIVGERIDGQAADMFFSGLKLAP